MRKYVFIYGSMLDPESLGRTLVRRVDPAEIRDAVLLDHLRVWRVHIPVVSVDTGASLDAVFLDIRHQPGAYVNGALISVTDSELARLQVREKQYDDINVTGSILPLLDSGEIALAFVSKPEYRMPRVGALAAVPEKYRTWVNALAANRGETFLRRFRASTVEAGVESFAGAYTFADPAQSAAV